MPVVRAADATVHEMHHARFAAYVSPAVGSRELSAWRTEFPARYQGIEHRITREEVLLLLDGAATVTVDGDSTDLAPGDVMLAPAGSAVRIDTPADRPARLWVAAPVGLEAELADGSRVAPPWVRG